MNPLRSSVVSCAILAFAAAAVAAEQYIVIASGELRVGAWTAGALATNPYSTPVHIRVTAAYPREGSPPCTAPLLAADIAPFDTYSVFPSVGACLNDVQAYVFEAERPLNVTALSYGLSTCPALQILPVPSDWFPPDRDIVFTRIRYQPSNLSPLPIAGSRVNFVVVNPEARELRLTYSHLGPSAPVHSLRVAAQALLIAPFGAGEFICYDGHVDGVPFDATCGVVVRGDGRFYAGFSVIDNSTNIAVFRTGLVLPADGSITPASRTPP